MNVVSRGEVGVSDTPVTAYEIVAGWAARMPDAPAFVEQGHLPLTYGGLKALSDRFREALNSHGLGRNNRVAIIHPSDARMAAAVVGVVSCATVVPLNPDYTVGELAIHFRDLHIDAVLVAAGQDGPARQAAAQLGIPVLEIEVEDDRIAGQVALRTGSSRRIERPGVAELDDTAVVLMTSGTTSHSKIVAFSHRELWWGLAIAGRMLVQSADDRCLNLMPLYHGHGIRSGLFVALWAGGSTIMMERFSTDLFAELVRTLEPTWYTGAFTFHHQILAHADRLKPAIEGSKLRFGRSGSGALAVRVGAELEEKLGIPIIQNLATTETGIIACESLPPRQRKRGSVGLPADDGVAIMNADGELLPTGERGEIVVRGQHVFQGYENDAAANAAAFRDGWFRTGDEGVFDEDGFLFVTGRIKEHINRGGEKITPSEVEEAMQRHPDVVAAVVFPIPHPTLGEEVAAAAVLEKGAVLSDELLARFLKKNLAPFKVPRRILFVDSIPKGPTGKFQRRSMAAALGIETNGAAPNAGPGKSRPPTQLEATLQRLWAEALGLDAVGLYDDFFLLGGDSLQAVDLFLAIEKEIGRRLPRAVLFDAGTIAEMAARIEQDLPSQCIVPIQPEGDRPPFFCVHDQNGHVLNFRDLARHLGPEQPFYGVQYVAHDGDGVAIIRMEDMAAHYLGEIRKVQPQGPYYLGGYSFGGRVAYVMAQQLRAAGETVALLALLDTYYIVGETSIGVRQWLSRHRDRVSKLPLRDMPGYLAIRLRNAAVMAKGGVRSRALRAIWRVYEMLNRPIPGALHQPADANELIRRNYRPEPYDGDAVLFKAELPTMKHPIVHDGWRDLILGGVEYRPVPGRHFDFVKEPHVRSLAVELAACLAERRARYEAGAADPPQDGVAEPAQRLEGAAG